jgi:hypothetical protein
MGGISTDEQLTDMIKRELDEVARHFNRDALRVWQSGIRWIEEHDTEFGVLSWEPFFIGLLLERNLFASRLLEVGLRRERLLYQLQRLSSVPGIENTFALESIRSELHYHKVGEEYGSFWTSILLRDFKDLTPEETLSLIGEMVEDTVEGDWQQDGSRYLEHPGFLDEAGLLSDAIIGEVTGNDRAFSRSLLTMARQAALDVDINIVKQEDRLTVFPSSQVAGLKLGRLSTERLTALEAQVLNRMRMVEQSAVAEFERLINKQGVREAELQEFLEAYPQLLSSTPQIQVHAHPVIFAGRDRLIPDFILETSGNRPSILDLKRPSERVLVGRGNRRSLATAISRGLAQLHEYSAAATNPNERARLQAEFGIDLGYPELCLVIGRTQTARDREDLRRLSHRELRREVQVLTYDDLLEEAKNRALFVAPDLAARVPAT